MFFSNSLIFFIARLTAREHGHFDTNASLTMRLFSTLLLIASLLPQSGQAIGADSTAPLPALQAGRTTLRQAETLWQTQQATLQSQRYGNALESFSNGLDREVSNLRVIVSDVRQWGRLEQARLWFLDGVLYRLSASFATGNRYDELVPQLSRQFGPPLSQASEPRQSYWQNGDIWLSLQAGDDGKPVLLLEHRRMARQARTSNVEVYAAYVLARPASRDHVSP